MWFAEANVETKRLVFSLAVDFGVDHGNGTEHEIGEVGEDGGATGRDEVCGEELVEFGEGVVDAHGGGEFVAVGGETLEEVRRRLSGWLRFGVLGAKTEPVVLNGGTTAASGGRAIPAAGVGIG